MASHQLAIAKASFSAGLLRPDPTSLSREDIAHFHTLLNSVVLQCSPKNVQICKQWILENIVQSTARFTALGKFLTSLAASFAVSDGLKENTIKREPSIKRKRLHLLYLLNDILYYTKYRVNDASICSKIQPMLVGLLGSAASFKGCPKHQRKIQELLDLWQENNYYSREYVDKLREAVRNATDAGQYVEYVAVAEKEEGSTTRFAKSAPYVMPAMHGDASTPWFDLPAGNLMPHIIPNSTRPINPDLIKPLQFVAGPADDTLVLAVKDLLDDVDTIYGKEVDQEGRSSWDIDELGQPIMLDEITGEVISGEGYYGWSRSFCEKMRRRKKGLDMPTDKQFRRSQSRSSSPGGRKRRYSDDNASSEDGFRSRRQHRSYSSSRSPSPDRGRRNDDSRTRSRSSSRSPLPSSRSPERSGKFQRDSRPAPPPPDTLPPRPPIPSIPPPPFQQSFNPNFPPPPPPLHNIPFNPQGQQFGVWPPPPPPPIQNIHFNPQNPPMGAWAPPPPPPPGPPPMNYQQQQQQYGGYPPSGPGGWQQTNGRGSYNVGGWNNGRGRGGYRGGRGW